MARILIVENDQPFAEALAMTLRLEGHEVLVAIGANEGVEFGLTHRPDVVVADWMLKDDLHGDEVCRRIRAACPRVKGIVMTGFPDAVSKVGRWSEHGETAIEKPFHKENILAAVGRVLSNTAMPQHFS